MISTELALFIIATLTSTLAAIAAMGGGIILVLLLPYFIPAQAVIPIHGVAQLASNSSRLLFSFKHVVWRYVRQFLLGAFVGSAVVSYFIIELSLIEKNNQYIPIFIACYLLLSLWFTPLNNLLKRIENFYLVGVLQTGLGLLVGAPGPMTVTLLYKRLSNKEQVIATASLIMGLTNANKVIVYALIGFHFFEYTATLLAVVAGAVLGSIIGTRLRNKIPNHYFMPFLKGVITLIAIHILVSQGLSLFEVRF